MEHECQIKFDVHLLRNNITYPMHLTLRSKGGPSLQANQCDRRFEVTGCNVAYSPLGEYGPPSPSEFRDSDREGSSFADEKIIYRDYWDSFVVVA